MNFKEEQERSVLSIFHQVNIHRDFRDEDLNRFFSRFLFHLFYDDEKVMLIYIYHLKKKLQFIQK